MKNENNCKIIAGIEAKKGRFKDQKSSWRDVHAANSSVYLLHSIL